MPIPAEIIVEKNKISNTSPWLILLDVILTSEVTLRLTNNLTEVSFQGETYMPYAMQISHVAQSLDGSIPDVSIAVSNADRVVQGYIEALNGAVDCEVILYLVHEGNLSSDFSDLERHFIIQSTVCTNEYVSFSLGLQSPTYMRFPLYRTMGNHCNWVFGSAECGYGTGTLTCDRTLKNCQSLGNSKNFGGFPGLNTSGTKFI